MKVQEVCSKESFIEIKANCSSSASERSEMQIEWLLNGRTPDHTFWVWFRFLFSADCSSNWWSIAELNYLVLFFSGIRVGHTRFVCGVQRSGSTRWDSGCLRTLVLFVRSIPGAPVCELAELQLEMCWPQMSDTNIDGVNWNSVKVRQIISNSSPPYTFI